MYCKNCGKELSEDAKFCIECGTPVNNAYANSKNYSDQNVVKAIVCPQCSSQDITLESDSNYGICNSCGTKIALSSNDTYNVFLTDPDYDDDSIQFYNISPHYSSDDCKRFVLDELADDDSPLDIYNAEFDEPILKNHIVLSELCKGIVDYSVSVGYDKKEPYQTTERYYDSSSGSYRDKVVTKYKDIIEWSPFSSSTDFSSLVFVDNDLNPEFDEDLLKKSIQSDELEDVTDNEVISQYQINEEAHSIATKEHAQNINHDLINSLPGDHYKDLDSHIDVDSLTQFIITVPCYYMSINYKGKNYTKKFFPIGDYNVGGDNITGALEESDSGIWGSIKIWTIIVCALIITSIVISIVTGGDTPSGWGILVAIAALLIHEYKYKTIRGELAKEYLNKKKEACEKKKRELDL